MSSSYRKPFLGCAMLVLAPAAMSQQTYFIPSVELSAEQHTNRELTPIAALEDEATGYFATLEALLGRRTERVDTQLRPRLRFQEYPDREGIDPLEAFLDFQTEYKTLRGQYRLDAGYARQDTFNAEFGEAAFDDTDPGTPDLTDSGIVFAGNTRTTYELGSRMERRFSDLTGAGAAVAYEDVSYDNNDALLNLRVGYQNLFAEAFLARKFGPRGELSGGPYVSRYEADDDSNTTDSLGVTLEWNYEWSELSHTSIAAQVERNEADDVDPTLQEESGTSWGLGFTGIRRTQVGSFRYNIGRFLAPSTQGGRTERDEVRLQYDRALSQRLSLRTAVRASTDQVFGAGDLRDRDLARADLTLRWMLTPTWFVAGGYRYAWQELEGAIGDADDNALVFTVGYRGLDRRQSNSTP